MEYFNYEEKKSEKSKKRILVGKSRNFLYGNEKKENMVNLPVRKKESAEIREKVKISDYVFVFNMA